MRAATRMAAAVAFVVLSLSLHGLAGACVISGAFVRPYQPTTILVPSGFAPASLRSSGYIFSQGSSSTGAANAIEFLAVNFSQTAEVQTLATSLPFLDGATSTTTFTPVMAEDGQLMAYVGDCNGDSDSDSDDDDNDATSSIWAYNREQDEWSKVSTGTEDAATKDGLDFSGPGFLGSTISFARTVEPVVGQSTLYSYGGMCPNCNSTAATWLTNATYTSAMTRMSFDNNDNNNTPDSAGFSASIVMANGPRSPQAGFTFTCLPSSTIRSSDDDVVSQEARYLLLGGHSIGMDQFGATVNTYLDISTAAIWNLPEESWSWVYISPAPTPDPVTIDSRSGHTAVLGQDESELIIMGGWVGNTTNKAEPQLLVVKLDPSYNKWQWHVPEPQPAGPGIYGHGAALLPGNVMMVYGGYEIGGDGSSDKKTTRSDSKRSSGAFVGSPQFLNLTSMSWSTRYVNPSYHDLDGKTPGDDDPDAPDSPFAPSAGNGTDVGGADDDERSNSNKHLGLGLGLGLGAVGALALGLLGCLLYRRRRSRRARDETVRSLAQDASQFILDEKMAQYPYPTFGRHRNSEDRDARRLGGLGSPVSPTHRRPRHASVNRRSYYSYDKEADDDAEYSDPDPCQRRTQMQARADPVLRSPRANYSPAQSAFAGTTAIHPIYEDEEEGLEEDEEDDEEDGGDDDDRVEEFPRRPLSMPMPGRTGPFYSAQANPDSPSSPVFSDTYTAMSSRHASAPPATTVPYRPLSGSYRRESTQSSVGAPRNERDPELDDWQSGNDVTSSLLSPTRRLSRSSTAPARDHHPHATEQDPGGPAAAVHRSLSFKSPRRRSAGGAAGGAGSANYTPLVSGVIPTTPARARARAENSSQSQVQEEHDTARSSLGGMGRADKTNPAAAASPAQATNTDNNLRGITASEDDHDHDPGRNSKTGPGLARSWLGSLRRAFSVSDSSSGSTNTNTTESDLPSPSVDEQTEHSRPLGITGITGRRALLHRKQGRRAWEEEGGGEESEGRDDNGHTSASPHAAASRQRQREIQHDHDDDEEEDWDIERAAEGRLVQVVFTVPKEKLRVVNPEICSEKGDVSQYDASDHSIALESSSSSSNINNASVHSPSGPRQAEDLPPQEDIPQEDLTIRTRTRRTQTCKGGGSSSSSSSTVTPLVAGAPPILLRASTPLSPASECALEFADRRDLIRLGSPALSFISVGSGSSISRPDSTEIMTAEFVHMERTRPRTRVLEMVEGIESRLHVVGPRRTPSEDARQSPPSGVEA